MRATVDAGSPSADPRAMSTIRRLTNRAAITMTKDAAARRLLVTARITARVAGQRK